MSKYYKVVPITEKPEKDGWYYVMNPNREIMPRMIEYKVGCFHNHNKVLASYYLKPIESLPIDRDKADPSVLVKASKNVIETMFWLYTAGNGRKMSIQDSTGEKCWIVPDDAIEILKAALASYKESGKDQSTIK
jgi:hypothetical protein